MCFEAEVEKVGAHVLGQENANQNLPKHDGIASICCRRCEYPALHLPYVTKTQFAYAIRTHIGTRVKHEIERGIMGHPK
jgi:hypothetical protein